MSSKSNLWESLLVGAIVMLATICAQAQAQNAEEGKVVTIDGAGDSDLEEEVCVVDESVDDIVDEPIYWIGVQGRSIESEVLRTHLQLAAELGVVVEQVIEESPAAKAGLRRHDIILRVGRDTVDNMRVLQEQVRSGKDKPLELKIIRLGKKETIIIVPEPRPEQLNLPQNDTNRFRGMDRLRAGEGDLMQQLMQQFGNRNIGPGVIFRGGGQQLNMNQLPNGISVSVQRNNNGPAQIIVKQGDQTWEIIGDDKESLDQLPADVRPFVERMLNSQGNGQGDVRNGFGGGFDFGDINAELERVLPGGFGRFDRPRVPNRLGDPMLERMEQLENQLEALNRRFRDEVEWKAGPPEKDDRVELKRFDEGIDNPLN